MIHGWILEAGRPEGILGAPEFSSRPALVGSRSESTPAKIRIGIALGGGFARALYHWCQRATVADAYASGASPVEVARIGCSMRFSRRQALEVLGSCVWSLAIE